MTLRILHEDDALIFVDKPPGVIVQRAHDPEEPTLLDEVRAHAGPVFLMQRLDRGTSGVMFFSKRADINAKLTRQFETRRIHKLYLALCEGELAELQTIDAPLLRNGPISFTVREGGKRAVTDVRPLCATPRGSLVAVTLRTGRTHQIRVHLSAIGHPLAGDWLYGQRNEVRPMLHASMLTMAHPLTGHELRVAAPLPNDFRQAAAARGVTCPEDETTSSDYS